MHLTTEQPSSYLKVKTRCSICNERMFKIKDHPNICKNCKTNIAFISRNSHEPGKKINNLKLRLLALTAIRRDSNLGVSEALRQAINYLKTTPAKQHLK